MSPPLCVLTVGLLNPKQAATFAESDAGIPFLAGSCRLESVMLSTTHVSDDVYLHTIPPSLTTATRSLRPKLVVVFFIPGNPGLIRYYHPFLSLLVQGLQARDKDEGEDGSSSGGRVRRRRTAVVVAGLSLGGFDIEKESRIGGRAADSDAAEVQETLFPPSFEPLAAQAGDPDAGSHGGEVDDGDRLYSLREQIELTYARIEHLVCGLTAGHGSSSLAHDSDNKDDAVAEQQQQLYESVEVVLMGHSVGAYIALDVVRLRHERSSVTTTTTFSSSHSPSHERGGSLVSPPPAWAISTCILLTPTVVDLHLSSSGVIATPLLSTVPMLPTLAHALLHSVLLWTLPTAWFVWLVARISGMEVGSHGFDATMAFLKSRRGVRQALYLARWELKEIRADRWGEEVWGATATETLEDPDEDEVLTGNQEGEVRKEKKVAAASPRLFFWFAKEDHWVADVTRENLTKAKARGVVKKDHVREKAVTTDKGQDLAEEGAPAIRVVETDGLQHAWCLAQNDFVARRVGIWVEEVLHDHT